MKVALRILAMTLALLKSEVKVDRRILAMTLTLLKIAKIALKAALRIFAMTLALTPLRYCLELVWPLDLMGSANSFARVAAEWHFFLAAERIANDVYVYGVRENDKLELLLRCLMEAFSMAVVWTAGRSVFLSWRRRRWRRKGRCAKCGYPTTGAYDSSKKGLASNLSCPECGHAAHPQSQAGGTAAATTEK